MQKGLKTSIILIIHHVHVDLCKHLGIDSSTDWIPIIRIGTQIYSLKLT